MQQLKERLEKDLMEVYTMLCVFLYFLYDNWINSLVSILFHYEILCLESKIFQL